MEIDDNFVKHKDNKTGKKMCCFCFTLLILISAGVFYYFEYYMQKFFVPTLKTSE